MEITYPRMIHSEYMTHRDRARNAASSRAIPWHKMKDAIVMNPVIPIQWGMEEGGMQIGKELPVELQELAQIIWLDARDFAVDRADALHNIGREFNLIYPDRAKPEYENIRIHKSIPNRITEPWMWITVITTATNWENLFRLRVHEDAEVHIQKITGMMKQALGKSIPDAVPFGDWHLPYITDSERATVDISLLKKASVARCARVSYLTHDGVADIEKDVKLFDRLCKGSGFGHWSPHEHVATPATPDVVSGPYRGWIQYRKFFLNECAKEN